jgi:hypothetical protein
MVSPPSVVSNANVDRNGQYATLPARTRDRYRVQDTPAGAPVGAPIRTAGDASF